MEIIKGKKTTSFRESIVIQGKVKKSPLFKRKEDCRLWLAERKTERSKMQLHGDTFKLHQKITIDEYAKLWLTTKSAQGVARSTLQNYDRYVRVHIVPFFKGLDLKKIQKQQIENFQINLKRSHNPKGINIIVTALKGLFREAVKEGYLLKSPCEFIKAMSVDDSHDVFWTMPEIHQFLKANESHELYELFLVALNTGMRKGELAGLCWDRVSFVENTITVTRTRDKYELKQRTKTKIKRVIPMNESTRATLLHLWSNRRGDSDLVFLKKTGEPINPHHIYRQFHAAQALSAISNIIRFHDLRHTFASQFVINGGSIYDLQKFLGHTDISMTLRYAHLSQEHLQRSMKNFSLGEGGKVLDFRKSQNLEELTQNSPKIVIQGY